MTPRAVEVEVAARGSKAGYYTVTAILWPAAFERVDAIRRARNPKQSISAILAEAVAYWLEQADGVPTPLPPGPKLGWRTVTTQLSPEAHERLQAVRAARTPQPPKGVVLAEAVAYWLEEHGA